MDQERAVNKVVRDMVDFGLISDEGTEDVKFHLRLLWTAGWEHYRRYETHHEGNVHAIVHFGRDNNNLGTYPSVSEASRRLKIPRKTLCSVLKGSVKRMRNGHYFKYIEECGN
jgi:hypothetical protein